MVDWGWCSQVRASPELQFGALREMWRHARGREHWRREPGSALSGGYAPDSAKAQGSSIVGEPGEGWIPVHENQRCEPGGVQGKSCDVLLRFFSSYEDHNERWTGQIRGACSRMHRALNGWMLTSAPASPAQRLHHHGSRYFNFPKTALVVWNSWSRPYAPHIRENLLPRYISYYNRRLHTWRYLYRPPGLLHWGGCTWTRISRQPITAITGNVSQQTLLEPLTVTGASSSCFGERYRDVLSQNLDENNSTQTSTDCCTVACKQFSYNTGVCVCATSSLLDTSAYISYVVMWNQTLSFLLQMMIPLLLCRQHGEEPTKICMGCGTADQTSMKPLKCECLARLPKLFNRPRCLRPSTVPSCSQLGDTRAASTWPSGGHHQASQTTYPLELRASQAPRSLLPASSLFPWVKNYGSQFDHTLGDSRRIPGRGNSVFEF